MRLPTRRVIPIFPLNMVAMPSALLPLNIFEVRICGTCLNGMLGLQASPSISCAKQCQCCLQAASHRDLVITPSILAMQARYRVLFNTLLAGESDIIDDMVNDQASWAGSRQFGMCLATGQGLASVGTTLRIEKWAVEQDGRMFVTSRGAQGTCGE